MGILYLYKVTILMKTSIAVLALVSSAQAVKVRDLYNTWSTPIQPQSYHYNEDPHSVPDPLAGKDYMTSTQAHLKIKKESQLASEPSHFNPDWHIAYNRQAREPPTPHWPPGWANVQTKEDCPGNGAASDSDSDSDSSSDDENVQLKSTWRVIPDVAELDDHVVTREKDIVEAGDGINEKFSGWHNPLADTDDGHDDDTVVLQISSGMNYEPKEINLLQYAVSEGPTKVDYGEDESQVVYRENDIVEAGAGVNKKFSGWHNPLADTDDGDNDESVLVATHRQ